MFGRNRYFGQKLKFWTQKSPVGPWRIQNGSIKPCHFSKKKPILWVDEFGQKFLGHMSQFLGFKMGKIQAYL